MLIQIAFVRQCSADVFGKCLVAWAGHSRIMSCRDAAVGPLSTERHIVGAAANQNSPPAQLHNHLGICSGSVIAERGNTLACICLSEVAYPSCSLLCRCRQYAKDGACWADSSSSGATKQLFQWADGPNCQDYLVKMWHVQVSPRYRLSERPQIPVPYFRQKAAAQLPAGDAAGMCHAAAQFGKVCQQPCANGVQTSFGHSS